jgi:polyisoprenoid-binding protein YceI
MSEIKPVAARMRRLDEEVFIDNEHDAILFAEQGWTAENVYIIPDTHRIVSVEDLSALISSYTFVMDRFYGTVDFDPAAARSKLRAIIDKEQS